MAHVPAPHDSQEGRKGSPLLVPGTQCACRASLHFLEDHCARNISVDLADAVDALYKRLRKESKT